MVLTDIEGSTALLHELGAEAYAQALESHRRVLQDAVAAHNGTVVDSQGDALFAVFPRAADAVAAATEAQEAFAEGAVRVRFGMHTGEPLVRNEGYVGIDLHRAARIMSVGHGGQVVVSETTARLLDGVELRDLGLHRLKDMTEPQQLYQLGAADFPPLRSLNQTNLPAQTTPIVGRETELAELHRLIADEGVRLVTLSGPGGSGKTRLALQTVAELVERNPAGVFWVSLAALESHELVLPAIAHALGVREVPEEPLDLTLRSFLSSRRMLLLLDNFEHVLAARTRLAELLAACPQLQIVVTSRAALKISGERVYEVPPLAEEEAVELFAERARQAGAEVARDATVAAICTRLDCLPLAIELAAARVRLLAPDALLQRLDRRLPLLRDGAPRSAGATADPLCDDRLEPRPPRRGGESAVSPPERVCGQLHARERRGGSSGRRLGARVSRREEPRSPLGEWSTRTPRDDPRIRGREARSCPRGGAGTERPC